jgi:hypothetical protein
MSDTVEDDSRAFVVYVPPNNGDKTFESCLRLGAGPLLPNTSTVDEIKTFGDAVAASQTLSQLSSPTYTVSNGIALLTPGTINLVAAGGVNTTSGSYTNSVSGPSYTVTQDSGNKDIISATYTSKVGTWATASFNQAVTVSVNTVPLQASIVLGPTYAVSGPLTLSNNWGLMWNSTVGFSVTATLARVTNIGWRTIVSNDWDGSNNQYYTAEQASSTAAGFNWTVPVKGLYQPFDDRQKVLCEVINGFAVAVDALAVVYAAVGLGIANNASPESVQKWLKAAEPIAIACTAGNGILAALGVLFSYIWVDEQAKPTNPANKGATTFTIGDGTYLLSTGDAAEGPTIYLDRGLGLTALGKKDKYLALNDDSIVLTFGADIKVTLDKTSVKLTAKDHSITVANDGIAIAGQKVTIEATTLKSNSLDAKFASMQEQLDKTNQAAATAQHDAIDAQVQAALLRAQMASGKK